ncbi:MAG TPA: HlyD family secretion protein [Alphaproteobacteria bacterium]
MKKIILLSVLLTVLTAVGLHLFATRNEESTDDAQVEAKIATISPRVAGYVTRLEVADNQLVKAGTVLLRLDDRDYRIKLQKAQAALESAQARLAGSTENLESTKVSAPSNLAAAQAQVNAAQAALNNAQISLKRLKSLTSLSRSQQQLDNAVAEEKTARANLNDAQAKLRSAQTAPNAVAAASAEAQAQLAEIKSAQADVAQAQKDLDDTVIVAPFDGRITSRGVETGNYVQPGQNLLSVVGIDIWVVANYKETQITDMKPGQPVDIEIDAYKYLKLKGHVDSIQSGTGARFSAFPPQNATGNFVKIVQRVPVKILLDEKLPHDAMVGPGLSVVPTVYIE